MISVIIASKGRPSLARILSQIAPQLAPGDELIVDVNDDSPWGHRARNRAMPKTKEGNGLVFYDDDDEIEPYALGVIRKAFAAGPDRLHIFRMHHGDTILWRDPFVRWGNVSTQMICVPRAQALYRSWGDRYEGDLDFIQGLQDTFGEPVWHSDVIATHGIACD